MAITQTPRLQLQKQDAGDQDWHTGLNAGMDNADTRLLKISSDHAGAADPNATVAGDYVGQMYLDENPNPPRWWTCTTAGGAGAATWRLMNTTGVISSIAKEGNTILEDILADFQTRISAVEDAYYTPIPRGYIDGLNLSFATTTTFGISAGMSADSTAVRMMLQSSAWTKSLSTWAAGSGNGALAADIAPIAPGWYHVFHMYEQGGSTTDIGIDTSFTAANLQGTEGFDLFHRIGSLLINGSSQITDFITWRNWFFWEVAVLDVNVTTGFTGPTLYALTVPPDLSVMARVNAQVEDGVNAQLLLSTPLIAAATPAAGATPLALLSTIPHGGSYVSGRADVLTDTSRQIRAEASAAIDELHIATVGWEDPRGQDV